MTHQCNCGHLNNWPEFSEKMVCSGCGRIFLGHITDGGSKLLFNTFSFEGFNKMTADIINSPEVVIPSSAGVPPFYMNKMDFSHVLKTADNSKTIKQLRFWLKEAEQQEDYERCAKLRDAIQDLIKESIV